MELRDPDKIESFFAAHVTDVRKGSNGQRSGKCPFHDDHKPSFSFSVETGAWTCHAGCGQGNLKEFVRKLGLPESAVPSLNGHNSRREIATYDYKDENGILLFQVVRYDPKDFRQRRPDGTGGWIWDIKGARRVLYHLPELLESAERDDTVFVVEGEKDVEALKKFGLTATCNPGGAGKWRGEFNDFFKGLNVVIIPDNDEPGRNHAQQVATALKPVAQSVKIVELPQ